MELMEKIYMDHDLTGFKFVGKAVQFRDDENEYTFDITLICDREDLSIEVYMVAAYTIESGGDAAEAMLTKKEIRAKEKEVLDYMRINFCF